MVKHIVLFKMKKFSSEEERMETLTAIKVALESLVEKIVVLKFIEVGINANQEEEYDLSLYTVFNNMNDLAIYANHPAHVAVAKTLIAPIKEGRSCVDYVI